MSVITTRNVVCIRTVCNVTRTDSEPWVQGVTGRQHRKGKIINKDPFEEIKEEVFQRLNTALLRARDQILSGIPESDHVGADPTVMVIQLLGKKSIQTHRDNADVLRHIIKNVSSRLVGIIQSHAPVTNWELFSSLFLQRERRNPQGHGRHYACTK
jgi:hypothetical protein